MKKVLQVLSVLAAVAGVVYLVAAYGDKLIAWCKRLCPCRDTEVHMPQPSACDSQCEPAEAPQETPVSDEDAPQEEPEQTPDAPTETDAVAEEADFEG